VQVNFFERGLGRGGDLFVPFVNWFVRPARPEAPPEAMGPPADMEAPPDRAEVVASNAKLYRQKGTGRARQGSIRATQWKGGGKPFGPTPRKYDKRMPVEMRRSALRSALAAKVAAGEVTVVEQLGVTEPKTKVLVSRLRDLGVTSGPTLLVVSEVAPALARAARNIPWLQLETPTHASAYQLLRNGRMIAERAAILTMQEALAK